jgi:hypothetical protein
MRERADIPLLVLISLAAVLVSAGIGVLLWLH